MREVEEGELREREGTMVDAIGKPCRQKPAHFLP